MTLKTLKKTYIHFKIISQECITKYKWTIKPKKAELFQAVLKASFYAHKYTFLQICRNVPRIITERQSSLDLAINLKPTIKKSHIMIDIPEGWFEKLGNYNNITV